MGCAGAPSVASVPAHEPSLDAGVYPAVYVPHGDVRMPAWRGRRRRALSTSPRSPTSARPLGQLRGMASLSHTQVEALCNTAELFGLFGTPLQLGAVKTPEPVLPALPKRPSAKFRQPTNHLCCQPPTYAKRLLRCSADSGSPLARPATAAVPMRHAVPKTQRSAKRAASSFWSTATSAKPSTPTVDVSVSSFVRPHATRAGHPKNFWACLIKVDRKV